MGNDLHAQFQDRIIWSIADRQTECWLLPLYASTKTVNCLHTLNQYLQPKFDFTINKKEKSYYEKASKEFRNRKLYDKSDSFQESMNTFLIQFEKVLPGRLICEDQQDDTFIP